LLITSLFKSLFGKKWIIRLSNNLAWDIVRIIPVFQFSGIETFIVHLQYNYGMLQFEFIMFRTADIERLIVQEVSP